MTQVMLENRSFLPRVGKGTDGWAQEVDAWDAVATSAMVHRVRWHTGLTQTAFAEAYGLDLDHLRAVERCEAEPDDALRAYLTVIDRAPDLVRAALSAG